MFYEPHKKNHGLPHDPFKAIIAPRPIGWISSMSATGEINLAPYSFFNGVSTDPPIVMFSSEGRKDSLTFVEETGEFVCSLATWDLQGQMNATSAPFPRGVNEMIKASLDPAPSIMVKPPRVKASPCALECKWLQTVHLKDTNGEATHSYVVFGQVVGIHIVARFLPFRHVKVARVETSCHAVSDCHCSRLVVAGTGWPDGGVGISCQHIRHAGT
jgi:flavin reductase (DIM6/NTAB) family NADH-FMN oxidoreductase RutF